MSCGFPPLISVRWTVAGLLQRSQGCIARVLKRSSPRHLTMVGIARGQFKKSRFRGCGRGGGRTKLFHVSVVPGSVVLGVIGGKVADGDDFFAVGSAATMEG